MAITDWPASERPREKLLEAGPASLSDAELLAIFLRTGVRGKSAVDLSRELLSDFGGLRQLLTASQSEFCRPLGLGSAKFALLQAVLEMAKRHLAQELKKGDALASPEHTRQYLQAQLRDRDYEVFACLFLDNQNRVIRYEELFRGTIDSAAVYPREVVKQALALGAAAIILCLPITFIYGDVVLALANTQFATISRCHQSCFFIGDIIVCYVTTLKGATTNLMSINDIKIAVQGQIV